jgi:hypothetical protein
LPEGANVLDPSPIAIREALKERLRLDGHRFVVMESCADLAGEAKAEKFARLIPEEGIREFVVYWPFGANRSGLDIELGFVLERLRRKEIDGRAVRVLVEDDGATRRAGGVEIDGNGDLAFVSYEHGGRTTYYADLARYRAIVASWADYAELVELLENAGSE